MLIQLENVQRVMSDDVVDMSLTMTAQMFSLPKVTVTKIVQIGLPMMAKMAAKNPELLKRMYAATLAKPPEPLPDFYSRMEQSPVVRQATMDDYKATYGAMFEAVNRESARQAGTTDGQARDVIAATLPAISQTLGRANAGGDQDTFCDLLRTLFA